MPLPDNIQGWSLWLPPRKRSAHTVLQRIINDFADQYGGPRFEPHVTLLGLIQGDQAEVERKIAALLKEVWAFSATIVEVATGPSYVQAVYLRIIEGYIMTMHEHARTIFGREEDPPFMPHLSLAYGDFSDVDKVGMVAAAQLAHPPSLIRFEEIELWSTNGAVENWHKVANFLLRI